MRSYTNDEIIERLDDTYASQPTSAPEKPDDDSYEQGANPLDTLPAPWWNWFIQNFLKAEARTSDAVADIYAELKAILEEAEIDADGNIHDQLLQSIKKITVLDIGDRVTELETDTTALEGRSTTLESDVTSLKGRTTTLESDVSSLEGRATTLEDDTTSLDSRVTALEDSSASSGDVSILTGRVTTLETTATDLVSRVEVLETWKDELPAHRFAMIGGGTTPTPAIP